MDGRLEKEELNGAKACVLRELYEETGLTEQEIVSYLSNCYNTFKCNNLSDGELADIRKEL